MEKRTSYWLRCLALVTALLLAALPLPAQLVEWDEDTRKAYAAGIDRLKSLPPNYVEQTKNGVIYVIDTFSKTPPDVRVEVFRNPQQAQFENAKCLLHDRYGYVWMGTNGGLLRFDGYQFKFYNKQNLDSTALPGSQVRWMTEDADGDIWLCTDNGYCRYNRRIDGFDQLSDWYPENYWTRGTDRHYYTIYQDPIENSKIWLTSWRRGLQRLDKNTGKLESFKKGHVLNADGNSTGLAPPASTEFCFRRNDGTLWLNGTTTPVGGVQLYSFNLQKQIWQLFNIEHSFYLFESEYVVRPEVQDMMNFICPDPNDRHIWSGSYGAGLQRFDTQTHRWEQFYLKKPIVPYDSAWTQTNSIWAADFLPDGRLVLGSSFGLLLFSPTEHSFHLLNREDAGMKIFNFQHQSGAFDRAANGQVFYANNTKALLYITTDPTGQDKAKPPKVYLHSFNVFPTGLKPIRPERNDTIFLDRQETSFLVSYYGLPFVLPNRIQYRCLLEGRDNAWLECDTQHVLLFENLLGGVYRLRLQARQPGSAWNEAGETVIVFQVEGVFWENWWFKWLLLGIFSLSITVFFILRLRQARRGLEIATLRQRQAEFQKRLTEIEMEGLRAQMSPHFMFNCLASINHFLQQNLVGEATEYLTQFARLVQRVLDNSQHDRLSIDLELTTLDLYLQMEKMRFGEKIRYRIEIESSIDQHMTFLPPMLIQPYVENALWHGLYHKKGGGEVAILISKPEKGRLRIIVRDNGIGRARARELESGTALEKKSHGMAITAERIDLLNQLNGRDATVQVIDLSDENGHAAGTEVRIVLRLEVD